MNMRSQLALTDIDLQAPDSDPALMRPSGLGKLQSIRVGDIAQPAAEMPGRKPVPQFGVQLAGKEKCGLIDIGAQETRCAWARQPDVEAVAEFDRQHQ